MSSLHFLRGLGFKSWNYVHDPKIAARPCDEAVLSLSLQDTGLHPGPTSPRDPSASGGHQTTNLRFQNSMTLVTGAGKRAAFVERLGGTVVSR